MAWKNVLGLDRAGVEAAKGVFVGELVFGEHGDVHEGVAPDREAFADVLFFSGAGLGDALEWCLNCNRCDRLVRLLNRLTVALPCCKR